MLQHDDAGRGVAHGQAPLDGIRVVDLSTLVAGPSACRYLGDFGADVVKVEAPSGDAARSLGPSSRHDSDSYYWKLVGRNKRSIVADLNVPEDRDRVERILSRADVLVENMRPGKFAKIGWSPDQLSELNPRLVVLRVTGFGQDGPYAQRPGFATLVEAMSGYASISGEPDGNPTLAPIALADEVAGLAGAFAVVTALYERDRSGVGQEIDISLLESMVQLMGPLIAAFVDRGYLQPRLGSGLPYSVPRGVYQASDGVWIAVSASAPSIAHRLLERLGLLGDPRFVDHASRIAHREELDPIIAGWIAAHTSGEVLREFELMDAAAAPVYSIDQLVADPHVRARGSLVEVDGFVMQGLIARFARTPGRVRFAGPGLDADGDSFDDWWC